MKHFLSLLVLCLSSCVWALDQESLPRDCDGSQPSCFTSFSGVLRSMASGYNFHAYMTDASSDFVVVNPGRNPASLYLVKMLPNGSHRVEYIEMKPLETRRFDAALVKDAKEYYLMSMQRFELADAESKACEVVSPRLSTIVFHKVGTPEGKPILVAVDQSNRVHHGIYGKVIGCWDAKAGELVFESGSRLQATE